MIPSSVTKFYRRARNWAKQLSNTPRRRPIRRLELEELEARNLLATGGGTWLQLPLPPTALGTMTLLSDGSVLAQGASISNQWYKLTPDSSGNYATGTWTRLANSNVARLYYGSALLPDGTFFLIGGEYSSEGGFSRSAELYDPVANTWTRKANFPNSMFGDDPITTIDPSGKLLAGYVVGPQTYFYDPNTNMWSTAATKLRGDQTDEEGFTKLPNGKLLSYDVFASTRLGVGKAQIYDPVTNTWSDASNGTLPVLTSDAVGEELGPTELLPNGDVFQLGANNLTAIYDYRTNSWTAGPSLPSGMGADDAPSAMLPDGTVIFAADKPLFNSPAALFSYDYTTNTISRLSLPGGLQGQLSGLPSYTGDMLNLPSGQLLYSPDRFNNSGLWLYTPTNAPNDAWRPTVNSVSNNGDGTFTLTGTQLTGISEGSSYGDDNQSASNYPIVQLQDPNTGQIIYTRTFGWSSVGVSAVGDTTPETVNFTLPDGVSTGVYNLTTIANGISSLPITVDLNSSSGPGAISGRVFNDIAHSGVDGPKLAGLQGWTVYIDVNNTGQFDPTIDPYTTTDAKGNYKFTGLTAGAYTVGEVLQDTYVESTPLPSGENVVTVNPGRATNAVDFGDYTTSPIVLVDDSSASNFVANGPGWAANANGYNGGSQTHLATVDPAKNAQWTLRTGRGTFELFATWANDPSFAPDATYEIYDNGTLLGRMTVNQQNAATQANINGDLWIKLGTFTTNSGVFTIQLDTNGASGPVDADAVFAGPGGASPLFYSGDLDATNNPQALTNERNTFIAQSNVYQNFVVPVGQNWIVTGLFSNDQAASTDGFIGADWSIRMGVSDGNGGTVVDSGTAAPITIAATGRNVDGTTEYQFTVNGLNVPLGPGEYWMNVTPVNSGANRSYNSNTFGLHQLGTDFPDTQYLLSTAFGGANYVNTDNYGPFSDFSDGVIGLLSSGGSASDSSSPPQGGTPGGGSAASPAAQLAASSGSPSANSPLSAAAGGVPLSNVGSLDDLFIALGNNSPFNPIATPLLPLSGNVPAAPGAAFNSYMTSLSSTSANDDELALASDGGETKSSSQEEPSL